MMHAQTPDNLSTRPLMRPSLQVKDLASGKEYLIISDDIRKKG